MIRGSVTEIKAGTGIEVAKVARRSASDHRTGVDHERSRLVKSGRPDPVPEAVVDPGGVVHQRRLPAAEVEGKLDKPILDPDHDVVLGDAAGPEQEAVGGGDAHP